MRTKITYFAAFVALLVLSAPAASRSADKIQVIYRAQASGEWQVFIFGAEHCGASQNMQLIVPKDSTQPLEVECDNLPK